MGAIEAHTVQAHLSRSSADSTAAQGRALENLVCYLFEAIPGISVTERNVVNAFRTEEVDIAFWNDGHPDGVWFLPNIMLVECKNWSQPVGSHEIAYFVRRLQNRGLDLGFLIAASGVTGSPNELSNAHFEMATALKDGVRVIVIDRPEIEQLLHSDDLVILIKRKLCKLVLRGTCL